MRYPTSTYVTTVIAAAVLATSARANVSYNDVAVIINVNSPTSVAVGNYFKAARSIPDVNVIYVSAPTSEEIDSLAFESIRRQVESHLMNNNLENVINYIVTTKGLPLKVRRGDDFSNLSASSSVESELSLILGPYAPSIGLRGRVISPYYNRCLQFSRTAQGIFLVTRLDGYTLQDIESLIDHSGPGVNFTSSSAFVLDEDPAWNAVAPTLNNNLETAKNSLQSKGKPVFLNSDSVYVTSRQNVIGYVSWGSNDHYASSYTQNAIPHNSWSPGAIVETYVSTSARSFDNPPNYGQSLIADLIREGASGAKGYVYEPYSSSMAVAYILFDRYVSGYNLAESYYMASLYLSWMDVVVGDPKTSLGSMQDLQLPIQLDSFEATLTELSGATKLTWRTLSETNNYGFHVQVRDTSSPVYTDIPGVFVPGHGTTTAPEEYAWTDTSTGTGTYFYRLCQIDLDGTEHFSEARKVTVQKTDLQRPDESAGIFELGQNYPNPFNPRTVVSYELSVPSNVKLVVYDALGREVTVLVNGMVDVGVHKVTFNGLGLASGAYYCRLITDQTVQTRRMLYLK